MFERQISAQKIPGQWAGIYTSGLEIVGAASSATRRRLRLEPGAQPVPWTWIDAARIAALALIIGGGAGAGLIVLRAVFSIGFLLGESLGVIPLGAYDRLTLDVAPFARAVAVSFVGGAFCCGLLYATYRHALAAYRLPLSALGLRRLHARDCCNVALLLVPLLLAVAMITRIQATLSGFTIVNPYLRLLSDGVPATPLNFILLAVLVVILAPVASEVACRGFLYTLLRQYLPPWTAITVSAALFALMHGVPALFPSYFLLGIVFAAVVEKTGSLYASILLHVLVNALTLASLIVMIAHL